ncbi:MAG: 50S ribosomal protein L4 [Prevotellaceae bacterium]|jgi:large subunit ribosomal protein L4|nr:50S ribosomal protein L4 [Prevotellaceae bacterium]
MELSIYNINGQAVGTTVTLDDTVFGINPNDHAIYLDVKQHLANKRQGTHKTKERSEVAFSTKKIVRQKGSGGARHGSIKANIYVGGGRVFGPKPHGYGFKLNKKIKQLARRSALSYKARESAITCLEAFTLEAPRTKEFITICQNLDIADKKVLMVLPTNNDTIYLSSRNLPRTKVVPVTELTTYDIINATSLVLVGDAVDTLNKQLARQFI